MKIENSVKTKLLKEELSQSSGYDTKSIFPNAKQWDGSELLDFLRVLLFAYPNPLEVQCPSTNIESSE